MPLSASKPISLRPSDLVLGGLAAIGVLCIWSGWVVISRLGILRSLTIYDIAALRFFVALVVVSPFIAKYWPRDLAFWKILVLSAGPGVPYVLIAFAGMQYAPASHAGILLNGTLPIFAALVAWMWLGQAPGRARIAGMLVILSGCLLLGWDRSSDGLRPDAWIGQLLFMAAAMILAVYMAATKLWNVTAMQALVTLPTVNAVIFIPIYLVFLPKAVASAPWSEILLQGLYQGIGPSVLGVLLFVQAVRMLGSSRTAATMAGVPGLAALLAIPVLGEWPSALAWIGLALTTLGILLTVRLKDRAEARI